MKVSSALRKATLVKQTTILGDILDTRHAGEPSNMHRDEKNRLSEISGWWA